MSKAWQFCFIFSTSYLVLTYSVPLSLGAPQALSPESASRPTVCAGAGCSDTPAPLDVQPTATPTVTPTVTLTPTPTMTPTPTVTPTSTPKICNYFQADMTFSGSWGNDAWSLSRILTRSGDATQLSCLDTLITQINATCKRYLSANIILDASPTGQFKKNYDDCFVAQLSNLAFSDWENRYGYPSHKIGTHRNGSRCSALTKTDLYYCPPSKVYNNVNGCKACAEGKFFFNKDCQIVAPDKSMSVCGGIKTDYQASSPISLIWEPGTDIEKTSAVVSFPLELGATDHWFQWKASEKAPLLVYDPEHTNTVRSAAQLFGHWTFGGQRVAGLGSFVPTQWRNGFEPLATLDHDGDTFLTGAELKPLALWFDENRNGVSEAGEVRSLHSMGVTKINTSFDVTDSATGALRSTKGFERVVDGTTIRGESVDWYGGSSRDPFELLSRTAQGQANPTGQPHDSQPNTPRDATITEHRASHVQGSLSGVWAFTIHEQASPKGIPSGYLVLSDSPKRDGVIGYSIVTRGFRVIGTPESSGVASLYSLEGHKRRGGVGGGIELSFLLEHEGAPLHSEATIDPTLTTMQGRSTVTVDGAELSYTWTAKRG